MLTSAAVGLLLEQGRLKLDDEIQAYVPEFPKKPWPVTLRQVMGHLAGVPNDGGDEGPLFAQHCGRPLDALQQFAEDSLRFEPGTEYRYSRYGWILVSAAVEAAADEPFLTFMQKQVFEPLGMNDTTADSARGPIPVRATHTSRGSRPIPATVRIRCGRSTIPATRDPARSCPRHPTWSASRWPSTAASCCSPPRSNCSRRHSDCGRGRRQATGSAGTSRPSRWPGNDTREIGHDGDLLGGMAASLMTFPEHGIVVAVTSNISYADTFALGSNIAQAFAGRGKRPARSQ